MKEKELAYRGRRCSLPMLLPGTCRADALEAAPGVTAGGEAWSLPGVGVRMRFASTIDEMSDAWDLLAPAGDLFFSRSYFRMLEAAPPQGMDFGYLLFYRDQRPIGLAYLQFFPFDAAAALRDVRQGSSGKESWQEMLKQKLARRLRFRVMACGNMLLTGEHGYYFDDRIPEAEATRILLSGLHQLTSILHAAGEPAPATLIKDVAAPRHFRAPGFSRFSFQPSMVFDIASDWKSFDDYLESLTSKYRVRARRARKKAARLERRLLSGQDLERYSQKMVQQYRQVADAADFNLFDLADNYFRQLQEDLPQAFCAFGYFQGEELLGFITTLDNETELEAHFLGFEGSVNSSCQLYLNMLYDIIADGIDQGKEKIVFARTALEIKSSVGAYPKEYHLFFRHQSSWFNLLTPFFIRFLEPSSDWTPRNPFK